MCDEYETAGHEDEDGDVVWIPSSFVPWEFVVSQLDDGHLESVVDIGESISFVVNSKLENA